MRLLCSTRQRGDDIANMRWDEIDRESATWTVPAEKNKSGRPHVIPLAPLALSLIETPTPAGARLLPARNSLTCERASCGWGGAKRRLAAKSGVTGWRRHDLRRTAASGMARLGADPHVVERDRGRMAAIVRLILLTGLRMSEWRGLPRDALALKGRAKVEIRQRADKYRQIGRVKSAAGKRSIDLGPDSVRVLRLWLMAAPPSPHGLVFPDEAGQVLGHERFYRRQWPPLLEAAGLLSPAGRPLYSPHDCRHYAGPALIADGADMQEVRTLMGHSTIKTTMDIYGHLLDGVHGGQARAAGAERRLLT